MRKLRIIAEKMPCARRGRITGLQVGLLVTLVILVLLFTNILNLGRVPPVANNAPQNQPGQAATPNAKEPLVVFCAASNFGVMEAIRKDYEADTGVAVQVQYGASQALLASVEVSKTGDLYLPADDSFLGKARDKQLVEKEFPLADMHVVIAVPQGNPLGIKTLDDILMKDLRFAQGNTESTGIGVVTQRVLSAQGKWDALKDKTIVFKTTVNDVANDVKLNAVDAGIVYNVVLHAYPTLEGVAVPELKDAKSRVGVCTLTTSRLPKEAERFARYLTARDKGLQRYAEFGFEPVEGELWSDQQARGNE